MSMLLSGYPVKRLGLTGIGWKRADLWDIAVGGEFSRHLSVPLPDFAKNDDAEAGFGGGPGRKGLFRHPAILVTCQPFLVAQGGDEQATSN